MSTEDVKKSQGKKSDLLLVCLAGYHEVRQTFPFIKNYLLQK